MSFSMIHVSPVIRAGSISWQDEYTWGAGAIFNAFFSARCPSRMVSHVVGLVVSCQKHSPRRWMFQHFRIRVNLTPPHHSLLRLFCRVNWDGKEPRSQDVGGSENITELQRWVLALSGSTYQFFTKLFFIEKSSPTFCTDLCYACAL